MAAFNQFIRLLCCSPIHVYQWVISPLFPSSCRFSPTCSRYAIDAILRHGVVRGVWLSVIRIARCQPWGGTGPDPVPKVIPRIPTTCSDQSEPPNQ